MIDTSLRRGPGLPYDHRSKNAQVGSKSLFLSSVSHLNASLFLDRSVATAVVLSCDMEAYCLSSFFSSELLESELDPLSLSAAIFL